LREVACDFCGGESTSAVLELQDLLLGLPGAFSLVECNTCGLLFLNPRPGPEELQAHYPDHYHPFTDDIEDHPSPFVRFVRRYGLVRRCRAALQGQEGGRLLDVGCSTGLFLNEMRRQGEWDVYGVEPVASAAAFAREHFGLEVFQGTLPESAYPDAFFDVVTLWDVLEHVSSPSTYLREIHRVLKPGGRLVIKVPDPECWEADLLGPFWIGYDAPRHLFGFPRSVLDHQLRDRGFKVETVQCLAGGFFTLTTSLGFWLDAHGAERLGQLLRAGAHSPMVRVSTAPAFALLRQLGLGSSLTYFARKNTNRGER